MKVLLMGLMLAGLIMLVQGYARTDELTGSKQIGIVERVFVEPRTGVYLDRTASKSSEGQVWVHVSFPEPLRDGRVSDVAAVPAGLAVEPGDRIEMTYGSDRRTPADHLVTAVVQKHSTFANAPAAVTQQ